MASQQTREIETLLVQCWASVVDGGPTLSQQCLNVSCLLGSRSLFIACRLRIASIFPTLRGINIQTSLFSNLYLMQYLHPVHFQRISIFIDVGFCFLVLEQIEVFLNNSIVL